MGVGLSSPVCGVALELGVGVGVVAPSSSWVAPAPLPPDGPTEEDPAEGVVPEVLDVLDVPGSDVELEPLPPKASPTVVLRPSPLKLRPDTSSYVVMPAMVTPKTSAAATTGRLQLLTRAR